MIWKIISLVVLLVMSVPTEGIEAAAFGNNIDSLKDAIELKHGRAYRIYNLSQKAFRKEKFSQHVIDLSGQMPGRGGTSQSGSGSSSSGGVGGVAPPPVSLVLKLCSHACKFLAESPSNVVLVCCNDGRIVSCVAACSIMLYTSAVRSVDAALSAFVVKRGQVDLPRSHARYLKYVARLLAAMKSPDPLAALSRFSSSECILSSITLLGVPLFNRLR